MFKLILIIFISTSLEIEKCESEKKICSACISGYTLIETNSGRECIEDKSLKEASSKIENCVEISENDNNKCQKCKREYILSYNKKRCEYRPHCSEVDINNKCVECYSPYTLNNGQCIKNPPCSKIENDKCNSCLLNYRLDSYTNICTREYDIDCKTKNPNDLSKCLECYSNYEIDTDGRCKKKNYHCLSKSYNINYIYFCEECEEGYYLNETNIYDEEENVWDREMRCFPNPAHCLKFDKKCLECETGYYPYNTECKEGLHHCVYGNSNECSECETGYYYEDYECLVIPVKNCLKYKKTDDTWKCEKCADKYYLNNNECKSFPDKNCVSYNEDGTLCESCENGFYLDANKCVYYLVENCLEYEEFKCSSCVEGFMLNKEKNECVNTCKSTEKICGDCQSFYGSFDYGKSCIRLDNEKDEINEEKVDKIKIDDKSKFININIIFWILIFIY